MAAKARAPALRGVYSAARPTPGTRQHIRREMIMRKWTRPTVRQVTCGMEINMYFPAEL